MTHHDTSSNRRKIIIFFQKSSYVSRHLLRACAPHQQLRSGGRSARYPSGLRARGCGRAQSDRPRCENERRGVVQRAPCLHVRAAFRLGVSCRFIVLQLWLGHVRLAAAPRRRTHEHGAFERRPPAEARCAAAAASSSLVWSCPFLVRVRRCC